MPLGVALARTLPTACQDALRGRKSRAIFWSPRVESNLAHEGGAAIPHRLALSYAGNAYGWHRMTVRNGRAALVAPHHCWQPKFHVFWLLPSRPPASMLTFSQYHDRRSGPSPVSSWPILHSRTPAASTLSGNAPHSHTEGIWLEAHRIFDSSPMSRVFTMKTSRDPSSKRFCMLLIRFSLFSQTSPVL